MQLGRNKHYAKAKQPHRQPGRPARPFEIDRNRPDAPPVSAARLAAEAAFASPPFSVPQNSQAQITVRRARVIDPAEAASAGSLGGAPALAPKAPRVFRIETARSLETVPAERARAFWADDLHLNTPSAPAKRRKRRLEDNQRPGPVVVVVQQPPAPRAPKPSVQAAPKLQAWAVHSNRLAAQPAAAQEARSFVFIDDAMAAQWQRLSQRADELRKAVRRLGR